MCLHDRSTVELPCALGTSFPFATPARSPTSVQNNFEKSNTRKKQQQKNTIMIFPIQSHIIGTSKVTSFRKRARTKCWCSGLSITGGSTEFHILKRRWAERGKTLKMNLT